MGWVQTRARLRALKDVRTTIEAGAGDDLPWDDRLQEIFGDPDSLVAALRYGWQLTVQAQLDPELPAATLATTRRDLVAANRGLLRVLARHTDLDWPVGPLAIEDDLWHDAKRSERT